MIIKTVENFVEKKVKFLTNIFIAIISIAIALTITLISFNLGLFQNIDFNHLWSMNFLKGKWEDLSVVLYLLSIALIVNITLIKLTFNNIVFNLTRIISKFKWVQKKFIIKG